MAEVRQDPKRAALRVPDPRFPTKIPAGRWSSTNKGHTRAVCGCSIPAERLTITSGLSGALCMTYVMDATSPMPARSSRGGKP